jgi:hypothetical protein
MNKFFEQTIIIRTRIKIGSTVEFILLAQCETWCDGGNTFKENVSLDDLLHFYVLHKFKIIICLYFDK